ncbi:MAG: oligosaccharide flippase family protein [Blastocatellia bacterium]|nr:oligosaccharide flippase family protein [Blastocatellia bacterium]
MEKESVAKTAGRGTLYITFSKLYFIASGYGIYLSLPRILTPDQFGLYGVVTGIVSIINAVINLGTQQSVSKFVSEDKRRAESVKKQALKIQIFVGGGVTIAYLLLTPVIAKLVNDPNLTNPLRISALITISYTFYSVFIGYLNGQKKFFRQSILDVTYSTVKVILIVLLGFLIKTVSGAILGFGLAAFIVLCLAPIVAGKAEDQIDHRPSVEAFLKFQFALLGTVLVNNLLQKLDLILIKAVGSTSSSQASEMAGYYTALIAVANITYQAIVSISFVIFPLISNATFEDRKEEVRSYIRQTSRYTLMMMALSATIFSSNSSAILGLLYKKEYMIGALPLSIVAYGMLFFGLIYIFSAIVSSSGRPKVAFSVGVLTLVANFLLNSLLIPKYGLMGAAIGTTTSMLVGASLLGIYILRTFQVWIGFRSLIFITSATFLAYEVGLIFSAEKIYTLAVAIGVQVGVYLAVLLIAREIGYKEIEMIGKMLPVRSGTGRSN